LPTLGEPLEWKHVVPRLEWLRSVLRQNMSRGLGLADDAFGETQLAIAAWIGKPFPEPRGREPSPSPTSKVVTEDEFSAWLTTIALRRGVDVIRKERRHHTPGDVGVDMVRLEDFTTGPNQAPLEERVLTAMVLRHEFSEAELRCLLDESGLLDPRAEPVGGTERVRRFRAREKLAEGLLRVGISTPRRNRKKT
jgi:hypothetical protein